MRFDTERPGGVSNVAFDMAIWLSSRHGRGRAGHYHVARNYTDITPLFYAAIVISAWFGGRGPGLLAVVLATVAVDYYFTPPLYSLRPDLKPIGFLIVFGLLAILTSWMGSKRRRAEEIYAEPAMTRVES